MSSASVLVVDDDANLRRVIEYDLREAGHSVVAAASGEEALRRLDDGFDVVVTDVRLGDMSGLDVLAEVKARDPETVVIVVTAYGAVQDAVQAMKLGAHDYLTKPFDLEALALTVDKALRYRALAQENLRLRAELIDRFSFQSIIGVSPKMQAVFETLRTVAASDATVLITGETGTGKELIARALHHNSTRHDAPLVTVNCAAIPEQLLESELFGHVKGAFTGAIENKKGKLDLAQGGTIFLDEVAELGGALQAKLLRFLQERQIEPLGGTTAHRIDARVVAATNKDLSEAIKTGAFRDDLFYRLAVVPIGLPPLRERRDDIPLLAGHFLRKHADGRDVKATPEALALLRAYDWPGNVRELENICERIVVFLSSDTVTAAEVPEIIRSERRWSEGFRVELPEDGISLEEVEKAVIVEALERSNQNRSRAARFLRIPRHILLYRLRKFGLAEPRTDDEESTE